MGLVDQPDTGQNVHRASCIFTGKKINNVTIEKSTFENNSLTFMNDLVKRTNSDLFNMYPQGYFSSSHAPMINSFSIDESRDDISVSILSSHFSNQINFQTMGLDGLNQDKF